MSLSEKPRLPIVEAAPILKECELYPSLSAPNSSFSKVFNCRHVKGRPDCHLKAGWPRSCGGLCTRHFSQATTGQMSTLFALCTVIVRFFPVRSSLGVLTVNAKERELLLLTSFISSAQRLNLGSNLCESGVRISLLRKRQRTILYRRTKSSVYHKW